VKLLPAGCRAARPILYTVTQSPDGFVVNAADGLATRLVPVLSTAPRYVFEIDDLSAVSTPRT